MDDNAAAVAGDITVMLSTAREELVRADTKASILLAAFSIISGPLLSAGISGDWGPGRIHNAVEWLWWVGMLLAVAVIGLLAYAVYPRTRRQGGPAGLVYFADIAVGTEERLRTLTKATKSEPDALLDQLWQVSRIVAKKYRAIQLALWSFTFAAVTCVIVIVIEALLP